MKNQFGPEYVIRVYDPKIGMEGFLVIDNTALGAGKGGIRMTSSVTEHEVWRLASTMTWKNALAGIPFGGAKAGIVWHGGSNELKKKFVQSFARLIKPFMPKKYIAGPDVNTGEKEMQWFAEATGNWRTATGKPANYCMKISGRAGRAGKKCGLPHELGSTGFGVAHSTAVAAEIAGIDIRGAKVSIHGFGNVGTFTYKHLREAGAVIIAIADSKSAVFAENGLDDKEIQKVIQRKKRLKDCTGCKKISSADFWKIPTDILIPASVTDVINEKNKNHIRTKIIVEGSNIPMKEKIEKQLSLRGILVVPDFVANAGGVISSYAEYRGFSPKKMFDLVEKKIKKSTRMVLERSVKLKKNPREVGLAIAKELVLAKMQE